MNAVSPAFINIMRLFLIDYENVNSAGLHGIGQASAEDRIILFYSHAANTLSFEIMDEMMDATSSGIVGEHHKPTFVLNYKGFYEPLKQQIEHMKSLQFIPQDEHYRPIFVNTFDELYQEINNIKTK